MRLMTFALAGLSAAVLLAVPERAVADTYSIVSVGSDQMEGIGLNDTGFAVFVDYGNACSGQGPGPCYFSFQDGVAVSSSSAMPDVAFDNGTACTLSLPAGYYPKRSTCNGGRAIFEGAYTNPANGNTSFGIWDATDLAAGAIPGAGGRDEFLLLASSGDFLFTDDNLDYQAIDLTTRAAMAPEPATFGLLGTGLLSLAGVMGRRRA